MLVINQNSIATSDLVLGDSGGVEYQHGQSITVLAGGTDVFDVAIYFGVTTGSPTGVVTIQIETDNADAPSNTLAHANATKTFTPVASSWNRIDFTKFNLAAGTYWIKLINIGGQANDNNWGLYRGTDANSYTGGHLKYNTGGGWLLYDVDLSFRLNYYQNLLSGANNVSGYFEI